ncbi:Uncharacterised protein [uncultured archaeon]|nr:Uncharacterised protein [uncultured archaeon]
MQAATIRKVQKIRRNNIKRERIQKERTRRIIMGLYGPSVDTDLSHLKEGYKDGFGLRVSKRNPSKEYTPRRAASTPFMVEPDETTEAPLTAVMGRALDLSFLAENDRMDETPQAAPTVDDNPETVEAFEGLEAVKEEAIA